jgi:hypothetical protein
MLSYRPCSAHARVAIGQVQSPRIAAARAVNSPCLFARAAITTTCRAVGSESPRVVQVLQSRPVDK